VCRKPPLKRWPALRLLQLPLRASVNRWNINQG
jgi:hypothetical protein